MLLQQTKHRFDQPVLQAVRLGALLGVQRESARGRLGCGGGAALFSLFDADAAALALAEPLALEGSGQPFVTHPDVPDCSV